MAVAKLDAGSLISPYIFTDCLQRGRRASKVMYLHGGKAIFPNSSFKLSELLRVGRVHSEFTHVTYKNPAGRSEKASPPQRHHTHPPNPDTTHT
jgi:hypothetical protein